MNNPSTSISTERTEQERNTLRLSLGGSFAAAISAVFYLYLGLRYGDWQLYAWSMDIWALVAAALIAGILVRRGRGAAGAWLLVGAVTVTFIGIVLLIEGTGVVIGVGLGILVAVIAGQTLDPNATPRAVFVGAAGAVACILLDLFLPPYRLPQPESTRIFVPAIIAVVILAYGYFLLRNFRDYSLRTKFLLSVFFIVGISLGASGYFSSQSARQSQALLAEELQSTVRAQVELQLNDTAEREALNASNSLAEVAKNLQALVTYRESLFSQTEVMSGGSYWDAHSLTQLAQGQYGNSTDDPGSVFIPSYIQPDDAMLEELNVSAYLDFIAPSVLEANPGMVATYFISAKGSIIYYPNIVLTSIFPADLDLQEGLFYSLAAPENDPERKPVWTPPYQDPAGFGLMVTHSIPVYDQNGQFRGVMGADVQLTRITEQVANIQVGQSGFAFLIDSEGRVLGMTEAGYAFFGLQPEEVPINEIPKQTVLGLGPAELQAVTTKMARGEEGLSKVNVGDTEYYLSYFPLESIGYSIGLIAPASELEAAYIATSERVRAESEQNRKTVTLLVIGVLVAVAGLSQIVSQGFLRPLAQLRDTAGEIAKGNLGARARVESKDEVGVLGETLNSMSVQLQELIGSLEQRVAERTKALATVAEVGTSASTILETDKLLHEAVELTKERFGFYHAHIYLLDASGETLQLAAGAGEPGRRMVAEGRSISLASEQSLVARAARERKGVAVNDVTQSPDFLPNPYLPDTRSELAVPMIVGDRVIGVFDAQSDQIGRFTDADINIQNTLASQIAVAIENARQYELANRFQQQYALVLESSNDGVWDWDIANNSILYSARWKAALGYEEHELNRGFVEWEERIHPEDHDQAVKALEDYLERRAPEYDVRIRLRHKDGNWRWVRDRGKALRHPDGTAYRMAGSHSDITDAVIQQELTERRARTQEALNLITQKIQSAATVESALKVAARELGHALGMKPTLVSLEADAASGGSRAGKENAS